MRPISLIKLVASFIFLPLLFIIGSCKKELIAPQAPGTSQNQVSKITTISYNQFLEALDIEKIGPLGSTFNKSSGTQAKLSSVNEASGTFDIDMSNVKKLVLGDTISYVVALKPKTKRAIHFENITVQTVNGETTAFITVYVPSREWIEDWRGEKHLPFKGTIQATQIALNNLPNLQKQRSISKGPDRKISSASDHIININNKKISLLPGQCESYDIYEAVPYQCSTGDWPGACPWETNISSMGQLDHLPGFRYERINVVNCAPIAVPPGPIIGGNPGGGGTTPNPPGDYNPCDGDVPPITAMKSKDGIVKLSLLPPTNCDDEPTPMVPIYSSEVQGLISLFNLQGNDLNYILNNQDFATQIYSILADGGFNYEEQIAAEMTIKAGAANLFGSSNANAQYSAIASTLPNANLVDPNTFLRYLSLQCALIKIEHPEYSAWRVNWEASKEIVHLMLDGVGLLPGIGEVADLTNGLIYTVEGDGVNAVLSYSAAVPFLGWSSTGAKMAKKLIVFADGTKTTLKWTKKVGNYVNFRDRGQLRTILKIGKHVPKQAHHIIPWAIQVHPAIQKAAKKDGMSPFHLNDLINGIPLDNVIHNGSHPDYDNAVRMALDLIPSNATPAQAYDEVVQLINRIRVAIANNPNLKINEIVF